MGMNGAALFAFYVFLCVMFVSLESLGDPLYKGNGIIGSRNLMCSD